MQTKYTVVKEGMRNQITFVKDLDQAVKEMIQHVDPDSRDWNQ